MVVWINTRSTDSKVLLIATSLPFSMHNYLYLLYPVKHTTKYVYVHVAICMSWIHVSWSFKVHVQMSFSYSNVVVCSARPSPVTCLYLCQQYVQLYMANHVVSNSMTHCLLSEELVVENENSDKLNHHLYIFHSPFPSTLGCMASCVAISMQPASTRWLWRYVVKLGMQRSD